ncbi:hypothetical protein [Escherichia coli]|uniref:hypothetical protein n=1 Tax=Escherichia coli TaxID=562 RepID=UPI001F4E2D09|nr:hypothetical protein [Escherichia coli]MCH9308643.1 hypothetical protein [Escherichia coli]
MQGLQRNVIEMAFCCKKSVGTSERQLGMNLVPTKSHSNYMGTTVYHGPNVIGLWWPVLISGFSVYARQWQNMATGVQSLRISLRIHHNGKSTAWFYHYIRRFIWCSQCSCLLCACLSRLSAIR